MLELTKGDILKADAEALVNTVNCVGVMGRGIALQFRKTFPENFQVYQSACNKKQLQPGQIILIGTDGIKETHNEQNELFGAERFNRFIRDHAHKAADEMIKEMFETLESFRFPVERKDDETLVVIKVL